MDALPDRLGAYRVRGEVSRGPVTVTLAAEHLHLPRRAWIKILKPTIPADSPYALELEREAAILARVRDEGVVELYEFSRDDAGMWLAHEDPGGPSLSAVLEALGGARLSVEQAVAIAAGVASALAAVHQSGVAHRALRPSCIWLTPSGAVKVGELAAAHDARVPSSPVPFEGTDTFGPPDYLAPEQILGEDHGPRTDVFTLGVVLYELLTGSRPFTDDRGPSGVAHRIRADEAPPLRRVLGAATPKPLELVVTRALAKDPEDRYPDAGAMGEALLRAVPSASAQKAHVTGALAAAGLGEALAVPPASSAATGELASPSWVPLAGRLGVLLAVMVAGGVAIEQGFDDSEGRPSSEGALSPDARGARGHVRVLAQPWAEVFVDGERFDVTPIGRPIPVAPGRHYFTFRHPAAPDESREVNVIAGQTVVLDILMSVERKADEPEHRTLDPESLSP